ncbi:Low-affinity potassium transport protein [Psilocybe cubensis]|uniref:Low-affinity potassium transport protein n=1 Tax=Psilocybe cubensis TaxID=181762 RepID=A0ACB8GNT5_PSICU|nr:Low-affinity potassium transport protein [Psilocybe cubensis]KAH9477208.1 Low-affinity potassium transport protein [Psilocybe cubensis]
MELHPKARENGIHKNRTRKLSPLVRFANFVTEETSFFRAHLAAFTFIPLIFSGIFYASNGRRFFTTHCEYVAAKEKAKPRSIRTMRSKSSFMRSISAPTNYYKQRQPVQGQENRTEAPVPSNGPHIHFQGPTPGNTLGNIPEQVVQSPIDIYNEPNHISTMTDAPMVSSSPKSHATFLSPVSDRAPRSPPVVGFAESTGFQARTGHYTRGLLDSSSSFNDTLTVSNSVEGKTIPRKRSTVLARKPSNIPGVPPEKQNASKYQGLGGFPGPIHLANQALKLVIPQTYHKMERTMTMTTVTTLQSTATPWLNFNGLVVGRNSDFRTDSLTDSELEDLGGAEYRALKLLSWLVPTYFVGCQLLAVLLFLPWLSATKSYDAVFENQPRLVSKPWFAFFQVMGAYTGGGLSLVDAGMVPFSNAYLMIIALVFVILAGNHALPIFLRLILWTSSNLLDEDSPAQDALSFLLEHPRRCFLYLFPSHQTWFLVICLVLFSATEWVSFEVLNLGLPAYEAIPKGPRILAGLFQGLAARASGFSIAPLASLAPALLFLYVVMMYIAIYPVALSIRSTNVYEERSLGIFEAPPDDENDEPADLNQIPEGTERVGRYLGWHMRRQLSIDIWWLVWAVFLVAIIERGNIMDESKKWFDLFRVLFELVSAFGGIGLSLGFPDDNFSFVGAMSPLSKLVVIVIMVRGRHRGLPVAVDRAVLLPREMQVNQDPKGTKVEIGAADHEKGILDDGSPIPPPESSELFGVR